MYSQNTIKFDLDNSYLIIDHIYMYICIQIKRNYRNNYVRLVKIFEYEKGISYFTLSMGKNFKRAVLYQI